MPKQGPGTKLVLKALERAIPESPDEKEQGSRLRKDYGTKLVLKGLERAFPRIAESNKRESEERERALHEDDGKTFHCCPDYPFRRIF